MCLSGHGVGTHSNTVMEINNASRCVLARGTAVAFLYIVCVALRLELVVGNHGEQMGRGGSTLSFAAWTEMAV